jgi:HEAT repeat protein
MNYISRVLITVFLAAGWIHSAGAGNIGQYVDMLAGNDEAARALARQMLPREGAAAVPQLLPLLSHEKAEVWNAAFKVIEDIANGVSVVGKEKDRAEVTKQLMTLIEPSQPFIIKERGLRLLPCCIPNDYDLRLFAALLRDAELREKARACLVETGTSNAAGMLSDQLYNADDDFAVALLNGLAAIRDPKHLPPVLRMADHKNPKVRAAALRAVAWAGDVDHVKIADKILGKMDEASEWETFDAVLRLADGIATRGKNREAAMELYTKALQKSKNLVIQMGAIAGLGRYGDVSGVPTILEALKGANGRDLEPAALAAFNVLSGTNTTKVLVEALPNLSKDMQLCLLVTLGKRQESSVLPVLSANLDSSDSATHKMALKGLLAMESADALNLVVADAGKRTGDDLRADLDTLRLFALKCQAKDEPQLTGTAYLALYQKADSEEVKKEAFAGIKSFPTGDSLNILLDSIKTSDLADPVEVRAVLDIVKALHVSGRTAERDQAMAVILPRLSTGENIQTAAEILGGAIPGPECAHKLGFVIKWSMVGPFPWTASEAFQKTPINEPSVDPSAKYQAGGKEVTWAPYTCQSPTGSIDLGSIFGAADNCTAYGLAKVTVPAEMDAIVKSGSDDGIKIWVNGKAVHENNVNRGAAIDQDQAPIHLVAGENTILLQVTQGGGGWIGFVRLTKTDGTVLEFTD